MIFPVRGLASVLAVSTLVGWACLSVAGQSEEGHHEERRPHHISVVSAGTTDDEETVFTLGLDYEYRVSELLGLGAVAEYAFDDIDAWTFLAVADIHLWRGLAIQTGPGVEFIDGDGAKSDEEEAIYRVGALYEVEIGRFTASPQLHYDLSSGEDAVVFGIALGLNF